MMRRIDLRSNEFCIMIGDEIVWKDKFSSRRFLNGVNISLQKMDGTPDHKLIRDFSRRIKELMLPVWIDHDEREKLQ